MAEILRSATSMQIGRTEAEIERALARAERTRQLQDEILSYASGYDPNALRGTLGFTMRHVEVFVRAMLPYVGVSIETELYDGKVLEIRLPEERRGAFPEFGQRTVVRVTMDRELAQRLKEAVLLDFGSAFFSFLVAEGKSARFDGMYATVGSPVGGEGILAVFKLRWQNDQGEGVSEELVAVFADGDGHVVANPPFLARWLEAAPTSGAPPALERDRRRGDFDAIYGAAEQLLAAESTRFKHPNGMVPLAAADFGE